MTSAVVAFLLFFTVHAPGVWDIDSWWAFRQIATGCVDDWQPPLLTHVWGLLTLTPVYAHPPSFVLSAGLAERLFLSVSLVTLVTWAVVSAHLDGWTRWAFLALPLMSVPVAAQLALLSKDAMMAIFIAIAILISRHSRTGTFLLLSGAVALRPNAVFIAAPVFVWFFLHRWPKKQAPSHVRVAFFTAAATLGCVATASLATRALSQRSVQMSRQVPLHDIAAIQLGAAADHAAPLRLPGCHAEGSVCERQVRSAFAPNAAERMLLSIPSEHHPSLSVLLASWLSHVTQHPVLYLRHRAQMFGQLIWATPNARFFDVTMNEYELERGLGHIPALRQAWDGWVRVYPTWLSRPALLLLLATLSFLYIRASASPLTHALFASMWAYELGYFFIAPQPLYRYSGWTILVAHWLIIQAASFPIRVPQRIDKVFRRR